MRGTLNDARPFTLKGTLAYENEEGWGWVEHRLVFDDGREGWLELDEGNALLHREWAVPAAMEPHPSVDGQKVAIRERGRMRLVSVTGDVPDRERSDGAAYVDGRIPGGRLVSLEQDGRGVVPYACFHAKRDGKGRLHLPARDLAAWDALLGGRR